MNPSSSAVPSPEVVTQKFDLAIALLLHLWPALTVAVTESWGGPDSAGKRDWFAGVVSDLFAQRPDTDEEDVEDMLLQVMGDEFECQLEDESEIGVAAEICRLRKLIGRGEFGDVDALYARWEEKKKKGPEKFNLQVVDHGEDGEEDDDDDDDEDDEDEDVEMGDAPELAPAPKEKPPPEVDEDGFTKVTGKKRR